jgi:hypothetical protein
MSVVTKGFFFYNLLGFELIAITITMRNFFEYKGNFNTCLLNHELLLVENRIFPKYPQFCLISLKKKEISTFLSII